MKYHTYNVNCETKENYYNEDGEGDHQEEDVFYTGFKEFPKGYMEHDTEAAVKENENYKSDPQRKSTMRSCPCGLADPHLTKYGSVRFGKEFLGINNIKERLEHLRDIKACFKCLQMDHKARECRARLKCPYCHLAGKTNTSHNAALCCYLDDAEFANVIKQKTVEVKQEPKPVQEDSYALDLASSTDQSRCKVWTTTHTCNL